MASEQAITNFIRAIEEHCRRSQTAQYAPPRIDIGLFRQPAEPRPIDMARTELVAAYEPPQATSARLLQTPLPASTAEDAEDAEKRRAQQAQFRPAGGPGGFVPTVDHFFRTLRIPPPLRPDADGRWPKAAATADEYLPMDCDTWQTLPWGLKRSIVDQYLSRHSPPVEVAGPPRVYQSPLCHACATDAEIDRILYDFHITSTDGHAPITCSADGRVRSPAMMLIDAFRLLDQLEFRTHQFPWDLPRRVGGGFSLYDYFKTLPISWELNPTMWAVAATFGDRIGFNASWMRDNVVCSDARYIQDSDTDVFFLVSIIVHEVRHSLAGGAVLHNCSTRWYTRQMYAEHGPLVAPLVLLNNRNDSSLDYRGATGVEYQYWNALATGTTMTPFPTEMRARFARQANNVRTRLICDQEVG